MSVESLSLPGTVGRRILGEKEASSVRRQERSWQWGSLGGELTNLTVQVEYLAELVEVCSYCGEACTGTTLFWHDKDGYRLTVELDHPTTQDMFDAVWPTDAYEATSLIFRDSNEHKGWMGEEASPHGVAYDAQELRALVDLLRGRSGLVGRVQRALDALSELSDSALAAGVPVFLAEN